MHDKYVHLLLLPAVLLANLVSKLVPEHHFANAHTSSFTIKAV